MVEVTKDQEMTVEDAAVIAALKAGIPTYPSYSKAMVTITNAAKGGVDEYIQLVIWNKNLVPARTTEESAIIEAIRLARAGLRSRYRRMEYAGTH